MTTSLGSAQEIFSAWQASDKQLSVKIWSNGMEVTQSGTILRNDADSLIIRGSDPQLVIIPVRHIKQVGAANLERVQMVLYSDFSVLLSTSL